MLVRVGLFLVYEIGDGGWLLQNSGEETTDKFYITYRETQDRGGEGYPKDRERERKKGWCSEQDRERERERGRIG